ncbi:hypothetical protein JAAARDRAFT_189976 [Jaapia argillacea MUCL 33604]|uniref:F-box domain-containing protein n=1 Tax=Jaapia argillacea MUCL 33604 TaxID=933084 RepID=A0A067Q6T2_9AGAM|nr:hypothetical protein JAAARDRAFT_189976 [Jaapia argillacea MUCL 33604]
MLPPELLVTILSLLDFRELLKCQTVSRGFYETIRRTASLQYIVELGAANYGDGSLTHPSTTRQRLKYLKEQQAAWKDPVIETLETIDLVRGYDSSSFGARKGFSFRGGVFVGAYLRGPLVQEAFNCLDVVNIRSITPEVPSWSLHLHDLMGGFDFDPAQDLLIGIERLPDSPPPTHITFHILSLLHGTPHPRAAGIQPIRQPLDSSLQELGTSICHLTIFGELVACSVTRSTATLRGVTLMLFHWPSGHAHTELLRGYATSVIGGLAFLSDRYLLISKCICPHDPCGYLDIYVLDSDACGKVIPTLLTTFTLPESLNRFTFAIPNLYPGLPCNRSTVYPSESRPLPFDIAPSPTLICCEMSLLTSNDLGDPDHLTTGYVFIISVPKLLQQVPSTFKNELEDPQTILWDVWGPPCTRAFKMPRAFVRLSDSIFGHRLVLPNRIMDFNQLDIARDLLRHQVRSPSPTLLREPPHSPPQEPSSDDSQNMSFDPTTNIVIEPAVIPAGDIYVNDVTTALPYREVVFDIPLPFPQILASSDLVGLEVVDGKCRGLHILAL